SIGRSCLCRESAVASSDGYGRPHSTATQRLPRSQKTLSDAFSPLCAALANHCNVNSIDCRIIRPANLQRSTKMAVPRSPYCTPDEYLAAERESTVRHEYFHGQISAMAGESLQHSQICVNLAREVSQQLKGRDCQALSPNMKVKTGDAGLFSYPDLT